MQAQPDDDGVVLASILELHHRFIVRGYSMLRFVRKKLEPTGLRWVNYGGALRNGFGTSFESSDEWVQSHLGVAFVGTPKIPSAQTTIPTVGLATLLIQLRWLERSPEQPVVWIVKATLTPTGEESVPLEPYLSVLFSKLARSQQPGEANRIEEISFAPKKYPLIACTGEYEEMPLASLTDESHVSDLLVAKVLAIWRS